MCSLWPGHLAENLKEYQLVFGSLLSLAAGSWTVVLDLVSVF